jgi:hypothetical protein
MTGGLNIYNVVQNTRVNLSLGEWNSRLHKQNLGEWNSRLHKQSLGKWNSRLHKQSLGEWNSRLHKQSLGEWNSRLHKQSPPTRTKRKLMFLTRVVRKAQRKRDRRVSSE